MLLGITIIIITIVTVYVDSPLTNISHGLVWEAA
jgi:hypothetical protein